MVELTSPPLRDCPYCGSEPETEKAWDWHDLTKCFIRIRCSKCGCSIYWVKFIPEDMASYQKAIDETSYHWNNFEIAYDDED